MRIRRCQCIPALRVGKNSASRLFTKIRAFWEDAAVDHTSKEWGCVTAPRVRWKPMPSKYRVDAVTTICEGLRGDIVARGIPASKANGDPERGRYREFTVGGTPAGC